MTEDIVHEATYPYPPGDVWRAIVTPAALGSWLMENDLREPVVGERFTFRDKPKKLVGWDGTTECEILEVVPERRLVLAFGLGRDGFPPTRVHFDLEPVAGGTRLRLRHTGFTGVKGWLMRAGMDHGWGAMVRHAIPYVAQEMGKGRIPPREETKDVRKRGGRAPAPRVSA